MPLILFAAPALWPEYRDTLPQALTEAGIALFTTRRDTALAVSDDTVAPLAPEEAATLKGLLLRLT